MALLGVLLIAIGGFSSGSFYLPLKKVKGWSWETSWLINGISAWVLVPWVMALITIPNYSSVLAQTPVSTLGLVALFGVLWGIGGLTFGLAIRYLGMSLGTALALGLVSVFSTLTIPIIDGTFGNLPIQAFISVALSLAGIAVCGWAGIRKEKDTAGDANTGVAEFDLKKGLIAAVIAGVTSACFFYGLKAGDSMKALAQQNGADPLWLSNAIFPIILFGGMLTNVIYCFKLGKDNKSFSDYSNKQVSLSNNYIFSLVAGAVWFCQFIFMGMGESKLPQELKFLQSAILFSFVIVFSNMWGLITNEWKGVTGTTKLILVLGTLLLVISAVVGVMR